MKYHLEIVKQRFRTALLVLKSTALNRMIFSELALTVLTLSNPETQNQIFQSGDKQTTDPPLPLNFVRNLGGGSVDPPSGPPSPKCRIDAIHVTGPPEKNRKSGPYFVDFTL